MFEDKAFEIRCRARYGNDTASGIDHRLGTGSAQSPAGTGNQDTETFESPHAAPFDARISGLAFMVTVLARALDIRREFPAGPEVLALRL